MSLPTLNIALRAKLEAEVDCHHLGSLLPTHHPSKHATALLELLPSSHPFSRLLTDFHIPGRVTPRTGTFIT